MAAFRADLEADEPQRQATALLQLLNAVAGGRDVAGSVAYACQGIVRGPAAPAVKRLAYELVRTAPLADGDWEHVGEGLKTDLAGAFSPEVAAAALGALEAVPASRLQALLADGALGARITACLSSSSKEVRAAAVAAVGAWLGARDALAALAAGGAASTERMLEWARALGDALLDPAPAAAAAAWAGVRLLLGTEGSGTVPGFADALRERAARRVAGGVLGALAAVLGRARLLAPDDQAMVAPALAAFVCFGAARDWALAEDGGVGAGAWAGARGSGPAAGGLRATYHLWAVMQVGEYLRPLLVGAHAATTFEAARAAMAVALHADGGLAPLAAAAAAALAELWDAPGREPARAQVLDVIARGLPALEPAARLALLRQLPPLAAALSAAGDRVAALARVWAAAVALDLDARRGARLRDRSAPATELKALLTEPFVAAVISGASAGATGGKEALAKGADYPAFREELVATLLETLASHPRAVVTRCAALPVLSTVPSDGRGEADELAAAVTGAAGAQAAAELAEWLGCAKIALQGTKACLGWEREPEGAVASYAAALQELLAQLLLHWKAVSPAVQPRALWVAAHHVELSGAADAGWVYLLRALGSALAGEEDAARATRNRAGRAAAAEGRMAAEPASAGGNPFAAGAGAASTGAEADEAELRAEGAVVAALAAERLAVRLAAAFDAGGVTPGVKEAAGMLAVAVSPAQAPARLGGGPDAGERCARAAVLLAPAASAVLPERDAGDEAWPGQAGAAAPLEPGPEWLTLEGFPLASPAGAALQQTKRGRRYWRLRGAVCAAVTAAAGRDGEQLGAAAGSDDQPADGFMDAAQVAALVSAGPEAAVAAAVELTGSADPLRLSVTPLLDAGTSALRLRCELHNRLTAEARGVGVRLALGGPLVAHVQLPPVHRAAPLPVGESAVWDVSFRVTAFGRLRVQPLLTLPARSAVLPGDDPALRCSALSLSPAALLLPPEAPCGAEAFFQRWASMACGVQAEGVAAVPGVEGGAAMLAALERGPLARCALLPLPAQGGFLAAYAGCTWAQAPLALLLTTQLLPSPQALGACRVGARALFRSPAPDVAAALQADLPVFLADLRPG
ncbi:hypothetical protein WJX81_002133 [Elliptochloris bilobata]|uniref:AP-5 complex subunit beta-1 n=1 Tax=Elliptochloris bilobata TaxID=381761 RepID=A0AAW1SJQ0_9CHLO